MAKYTSINLVKKLLEKKITISTIESITAGGFANNLAKTPGASKTFKGSLVVYSNETKRKLIPDLKEKDVYTQKTSMQLSKKGNKYFKTDICISIIGIAGPSNPSNNLEIGDSFVTITYKSKSITKFFHNWGTRDSIIKKTITNSSEFLKDFLKKM